MDKNNVKVWCESCEGKGWYSVPDYDWDENPIEDIEIECDDCDGNGYNLIDLSKK